MRNTVIMILVLLSVIVIVTVIIADSSSTRPGRRPSNPFAYNVDEFRPVADELIRWEETGQIMLGDPAPAALAYGNGMIYLAAPGGLQAINLNGTRMMNTPLPATPTAITVTGAGEIIVALGSRLISMDIEGKMTGETETYPGTNFTSVAGLGDRIYAADAAGRRVIIFNERLEETGRFTGESGVSDIHGFIVPGGHLSLAVDPAEQLWISNPGLHALQNYTSAGRLRSYIRRSSFAIEGFSGCCNPEYFTFLPTGEFVTSEKGIIRIKVVAGSGDVVSVVAAPGKFERGRRAPAVAADENGNVLALDFDRNMIRIFEPL